MMYALLEILVEQFYRLKHTFHIFNLELSNLTGLDLGLEINMNKLKKLIKSNQGLSQIRSEFL